MIKWWELHPIIAPLPKGFMGENASHKEAKDWMNRATDRIAELEEALREIAKFEPVGTGVDVISVSYAAQIANEALGVE